MSGLSTSPKLVKGGIVLVDPQTAAVRKVVALQYNPEKMSRSFQVKRMVEGADHAEALRLTGPAVETYSIEADIDAADKLEFPDQNSATVAAGIAPEIAVLESLVNPKVSDLRAYEQLANAGTLEIALKYNTRAWVEIILTESVLAGAVGPFELIGPPTATTCPIKIMFSMTLCTTNILGSDNLRGRQVISLGGGGLLLEDTTGIVDATFNIGYGSVDVGAYDFGHFNTPAAGAP